MAKSFLKIVAYGAASIAAAIFAHAWWVGKELQKQQDSLQDFAATLTRSTTLGEVQESLRHKFDGASYTDNMPIVPGPQSGHKFLLFQASKPVSYWLGAYSSDVVLVCSFDKNERFLASEVHVRTSSF